MFQILPYIFLTKSKASPPMPYSTVKLLDLEGQPLFQVLLFVLLIAGTVNLFQGLLYILLSTCKVNLFQDLLYIFLTTSKVSPCSRSYNTHTKRPGKGGGRKGGPSGKIKDGSSRLDTQPPWYHVHSHVEAPTENLWRPR